MKKLLALALTLASFGFFGLGETQANAATSASTPQVRIRIGPQRNRRYRDRDWDRDRDWNRNREWQRERDLQREREINRNNTWGRYGNFNNGVQTQQMSRIVRYGTVTGPGLPGSGPFHASTSSSPDLTTVCVANSGQLPGQLQAMEPRPPRGRTRRDITATRVTGT